MQDPDEDILTSRGFLRSICVINALRLLFIRAIDFQDITYSVALFGSPHSATGTAFGIEGKGSCSRSGGEGRPKSRRGLLSSPGAAGHRT